MKCIKFGAKWCGPCNTFAPIFEDVSKDEKYSNITFSTVDVSDSTDDEDILMDKANIRAIPCTVIFDDENNVIKRTVGTMSKLDFEQFLNDAMENEQS